MLRMTDRSDSFWPRSIHTRSLKFNLEVIVLLDSNFWPEKIISGENCFKQVAGFLFGFPCTKSVTGVDVEKADEDISEEFDEQRKIDMKACLTQITLSASN